MSSRNRARLSVVLDGPWHIYTRGVTGWKIIGTVQRGLEIGALAVSPLGLYVQLNAGAVRSLDQRKAAAAIDAARNGHDHHEYL